MLLRRAARQGAPLAAVAYGNELGGERAIGARLGAEVYAAGLRRLQALVDQVWDETGARRPKPRVIGPDVQWDEQWLSAMLRSAPWLRTLSYHLYPLGAGSLEITELANKVGGRLVPLMQLHRDRSIGPPLPKVLTHTARRSSGASCRLPRQVECCRLECASSGTSPLQSVVGRWAS